MKPLTVLALAALGLPRAIAHDLHLVGPVTNAILVFAPPAIWLAVVLRRKADPFRTPVVIGLTYGVLLAVSHQLLWTEAFPDGPPRLGGNLAGTLSPAVETGMLRAFAAVSSVLTGALVGAVTGAVAWLVTRTRHAHGR